MILQLIANTQQKWHSMLHILNNDVAETAIELSNEVRLFAGHT